MAQYVKQGNIFGRLGSGVGKGIAEQVPKEIERSRLASGLKNVGEQKGLTPFQQFTGLVEAAHEYPQIVQSGTDLLRQQAIINSVENKDKRLSDSLRNTKTNNMSTGESRSITTPEGVESTLNPYIPPSGEERESMARQLLASEPLVYPSLEAARNAVNNKVSADIQKSSSQIAKRDLQQGVQTKAEEELRKELATRLGENSNVPGDVRSKLQDEAIELVRKGTSEKDASKIIGEKQETIDREYNDVIALGDNTILLKDPKQVLSTIKALQKKFAKRGDLRNFAQTLISENGLSPPFAYSKAYPLEAAPKLYDEIKNLQPVLPKTEFLTGSPGFPVVGVKRSESPEKIQELSLNAAKKLAPLLEKGASPLAVYQALEDKGYDAEVWKNYLLDNQDELDLTKNQLDELTKSRGIFQGWLNDLWLKTFGG